MSHTESFSWLFEFLITSFNPFYIINFLFGLVPLSLENVAQKEDGPHAEFDSMLRLMTLQNIPSGYGKVYSHSEAFWGEQGWLLTWSANDLTEQAGDCLGVFLVVRGWGSHIWAVLVWFKLAPKVGSVWTLLHVSMLRCEARGKSSGLESCQ